MPESANSERERRGVEVLIVELQASEPPLERERRSPGGARAAQILKAEQRIIDSTMMTGETYCPRQVCRFHPYCR